MSQWEEWGSDHDFHFQLPKKGAGYVYVAWGRNRERPLYVGKAVTPTERIMYHVRHAPWAAEVEEWEVHGFPTADNAEWAEIEAIHDLNPIHNVMRRMTQAQWDEQHRISSEKEAQKAAARAKAREELLAREARRAARIKPPEPLYKPRKVRKQKWRDDVFTPDQLAIIARVQNRGRAA
jgi:hypothetical protein